MRQQKINEMIKKMITLLLVVACVANVSCKDSAAGDPRQTLTAFFEAMEKKDMPAARKLATDDSKALLDMWEKQMNANTAESGKYDKSKVEVGEAKIDGVNATVAVKEKTSGESVNFPLQKVGGAWKVSFNIASLMRMGVEKMQEKGINLKDSLGSAMEKLKGINLDSLQKELKKGGVELDSAFKHLEELKQ